MCWLFFLAVPTCLHYLIYPPAIPCKTCLNLIDYTDFSLGALSLARSLPKNLKAKTLCRSWRFIKVSWAEESCDNHLNYLPVSQTTYYTPSPSPNPFLCQFQDNIRHNQSSVLLKRRGVCNGGGESRNTGIPLPLYTFCEGGGGGLYVMLPQCALHLSDFDARQETGQRQQPGRWPALASSFTARWVD